MADTLKALPEWLEGPARVEDMLDGTRPELFDVDICDAETGARIELVTAVNVRKGFLWRLGAPNEKKGKHEEIAERRAFVVRHLPTGEEWDSRDYGDIE